MQPRERLTTKEMQVALLVWQGLTNREIALAIGTTEQVVKNYLRNPFDKLGVWSRLELALYVASHGGAKWSEEFGLRREEVLDYQRLNPPRPREPMCLGWAENPRVRVSEPVAVVWQGFPQAAGRATREEC
jgi:DNA-binding CsgD family transcriptional regulator